MSQKILPPKGTSDYFGSEISLRTHVTETIQGVLQLFGYEPLETPIVERMETLMGKYGDEAENLLFTIPTYKSGLRYDHTVPLARFIANNQSKIQLPFRRYAIGPVFRGENTQAGRKRQFTQCDWDVIGSDSPTVDAEVVAIMYQILTKLGFTNQFTILVNDRRLLNSMVSEMGFRTPVEQSIVMTAWDKLDKTSISDVIQNYIIPNFKKNNIDESKVGSFEKTTTFLLSLASETYDQILEKLEITFTSDASKDALTSIRNLLKLFEEIGIPRERYHLNPLLARGLSYYTGPVFETVVTEANIGSISGGGRYDELIQKMGGPEVAACGFAIGLDRLLFVMDQLHLTPVLEQTTCVLVTVFDTTNLELTKESVKIASVLRNANIPTEVYAGTQTKIGKQIAFADAKNIPLVVTIGPDEMNSQTARVRILESREESSVSYAELAEFIKSKLK